MSRWTFECGQVGKRKWIRPRALVAVPTVARRLRQWAAGGGLSGDRQSALTLVSSTRQLFFPPVPASPPHPRRTSIQTPYRHP